MHLNRKALSSWGLALSLAFIVKLWAAGDVRLINAVRSQNAAAVAALLKERVDVNAPQADGATALHWAVHLDDQKMVDTLIRAGAKVNTANDLGATPLYLACANRNAPIVTRLLDAGANANPALLNGETALMMCARTGEIAAVRALLVHGADVNAKERTHDQTALMWAAAQRHPEVTAALVEAGGDVRARSRIYSRTVTRGQSTGADRGDRNVDLPSGGSTPLLFAARVGDLESTKLLLAAGADVNDAFPDSTSVLAVAAYSGHEAVAIALLEKGADPNSATVGYTPLHAAVLRSELNLVKALLARGANPNAQITKGTPIRRSNQDFNLPETLVGATPYSVAAKFLEAPIMQALLAGGADPQMTMADGTTPLMAAAGLGAAAGGGMNVPDRRGLSVLDGGKLETESQALEAVLVVLSRPGDINAVNGNGDTALHGAASMGYDQVVQLLADKGARLNVRNKRNQTALSGLIGVGTPPQVIRQSTANLLRKLLDAQASANPVQAHLDNVMTSWSDTPSMQGFLPVAISDARVATSHAALAAKMLNDLDSMKLHAGHVLHALDPSLEAKGPGSGYGLKKAAGGALQHVQFAAKAEGASKNVQTHANHVAASLGDVLQWMDQAVAIVQKVRAATSAAEAAPLVQELGMVTANILNGLDADKDGTVGWQAGEGGLAQAQMHMGLMMKGEGL